MVGFLGPLIQAGASLLGGLMGGEEESSTKQKTKTRTRTTGRTTNDVNMRNMVREAEKNGFNPLTVLRAGGLAAYGTTKSFSNSFSNSKSKGKGSSSSSSPMAAGIAAAGQAIGGAIDSAPSATAENAARAWQAGASAAPQAEYDALQAQLKAVDPGTLGTQPRVRASQVETVAVPAMAGGAGAVEEGKREATNPFRKGSGWLVDPDVPDPGVRYQSEIGETLNDAYVAYHDIKKNIVESDWYNGAKRDLGVLYNKYSPTYGLESKPQMLWDKGLLLTTPPVVQEKKVPDLYKDPFPAWSW